MNSAEILIITHSPYIVLSIFGIIGLRYLRRDLKIINERLKN